MTRSIVRLIIVLGLLAAPDAPTWTGEKVRQAQAAQTTTQKKATTHKKPTTAKKPVKKTTDYCGYPAPPLAAGMSDFCAWQYDIYCRRGVGCNIYGR